SPSSSCSNVWPRFRAPTTDCSRTALPQLACAAGLRGSHVRTRKFVPSCAVTDQRRSRPMDRAVPAAFIVAIIFLSVAPAQAGPCTSEIAWFEQAVRRSAGNPNAGPMARQTIAAQLDRQPTPASIRRAQLRARTSFNATLARAKRLDARGNPGCMQAYTAARQMYYLP